MKKINKKYLSWLKITKDGFCKVNTSNKYWIKHLQDAFQGYILPKNQKGE